MTPKLTPLGVALLAGPLLALGFVIGELVQLARARDAAKAETVQIRRILDRAFSQSETCLGHLEAFHTEGKQLAASRGRR